MTLEDPGRASPVRSERGLSLLEVLVAILLIVLIVPFMAALEISALKLNGDAGELDLAMWAAQLKIEELRALGYDDVDKGDDEYAYPNGRVVEREWDIEKNKPVKDTKTITVVAVDRDLVDAKPVELVFVLGKRSSLGSGSGS